MSFQNTLQTCAQGESIVKSKKLFPHKGNIRFFMFPEKMLVNHEIWIALSKSKIQEISHKYLVDLSSNGLQEDGFLFSCQFASSYVTFFILWDMMLQLQDALHSLVVSTEWKKWTNCKTKEAKKVRVPLLGQGLAVSSKIKIWIFNSTV